MQATTECLNVPPRDKRDAALDLVRRKLACIHDHGSLTLIENSVSWDIARAYSRGAHDAFGQMAGIAESALADIDALLGKGEANG